MNLLIVGLLLIGFVIMAPNGIVGLVKEFLRVAAPAAVVKVPPGTVVRDAETGEQLVDMVEVRRQRSPVRGDLIGRPGVLTAGVERDHGEHGAGSELRLVVTASEKKRTRNSGSSWNWGARNLIATERSKRWSRAHQTSAIPPFPRG